MGFILLISLDIMLFHVLINIHHSSGAILRGVGDDAPSQACFLQVQSLISFRDASPIHQSFSFSFSEISVFNIVTLFSRQDPSRNITKQ